MSIAETSATQTPITPVMPMPARNAKSRQRAKTASGRAFRIHPMSIIIASANAWKTRLSRSRGSGASRVTASAKKTVNRRSGRISPFAAARTRLVGTSAMQPSPRPTRVRRAPPRARPPEPMSPLEATQPSRHRPGRAETAAGPTAKVRSPAAKSIRTKRRKVLAPSAPIEPPCAPTIATSVRLITSGSTVARITATQSWPMTATAFSSVSTQGSFEPWIRIPTAIPATSPRRAPAVRDIPRAFKATIPRPRQSVARGRRARRLASC